MKRAMFFGAMIAIGFCVTVSPLRAQRGHGGGAPSSGGGHAVMSEPGQGAMSSGQGISGNHGGEHPDARQGKQTNGNAGSLQDQREPASHQTSAAQLASNPKLSSTLQGLFPTGTNLSSAATGFKNMGDFVAAAHVSHNLGIPFADLKGQMLSGKSLGQAIHELKPDVDFKSEASQAQKEAKKTIHDSGR
jgi:hypothetical protein